MFITNIIYCQKFCEALSASSFAQISFVRILHKTTRTGITQLLQPQNTAFRTSKPLPCTEDDEICSIQFDSQIFFFFFFCGGGGEGI